MKTDNHPRELSVKRGRAGPDTVPVVSRRRSSSPGRGRQPADPLLALGLTADAGERDVLEARRRLAKQAHPDAGGSVEQMQHVNDLVDAALRALSTGKRPTPPRPASQPMSRSASSGPVRRDHPSFTVEALPVETFEALLIVGTWLGDLIDDEPPYAMEVALTEPMGGWCRLDLVPDAGASTVSIAVAGAPGHPVPSVDAVRDAFVEGLNRLDWSSLDT